MLATVKKRAKVAKLSAAAAAAGDCKIDAGDFKNRKKAATKAAAAVTEEEQELLLLTGRKQHVEVRCEDKRLLSAYESVEM